MSLTTSERHCASLDVLSRRTGIGTMTPRAVTRRICWIAVAGACLPTLRASAGEPLRSAAEAPAVAENILMIGDAALSSGGLLTGQLCDEDQRPMSHAAVAIRVGDHTLATTRTDANGVFAVRGLRGGVHQVVTADTVRTYRLWAAGTAPPRSAAIVRIVRDGALVRGQWGPPAGLNGFVQHTRAWASNPFVVGGIMAAAVAIPVAIHNADDPPGS